MVRKLQKVVHKKQKIVKNGEKSMKKKPFQDLLEEKFAFLIQDGFSYEYTYDKGSDSSCVYIYRFRRGRDFIDFRAVSGGGTGTIVVFSGGEYIFPTFAVKYKKQIRAFKRKHFFKKPTVADRFELASVLLQQEWLTGGFGLAKALKIVNN